VVLLVNLHLMPFLGLNWVLLRLGLGHFETILVSYYPFFDEIP
jgi:hypothetical protein